MGNSEQFCSGQFMNLSIPEVSINCFKLTLCLWQNSHSTTGTSSAKLYNGRENRLQKSAHLWGERIPATLMIVLHRGQYQLMPWAKHPLVYLVYRSERLQSTGGIVSNLSNRQSSSVISTLTCANLKYMPQNPYLGTQIPPR